ncbi:signal peptidase I [Haloglomus halophilum]|uniref:signal peptidase I n=1 Tax=Haloglomus halophilum TaxID=2962672 RepID=UPI0020C9EF34|nr:signal peptidase I [Haloglomus halophilum]
MSDQSDGDAAGSEQGAAGADAGAGADAPTGGTPALPGSGSLSVRQVFDVLLVVALVAVVVPFVVYAAPSLVGAEESYVVRSGSMEPAIGTGDVIIVERAPPAAIETGDVITFVPDDQPPPTTHRVVSKSEQDGVIHFTTKGDANEQPDAEPVVENELVGKVTLVLPYVGYVVSFAGTSTGFFALIAAPFGLLLATEVWGVFRTDDDDSDDTDGAGTPSVQSPDVDETDEATYTLSPTDIRLSLAVLLVLTVYSSVVAVSRPTPWSIAVAVGAFGTTVYLAAMRYTAVTETVSSGPAATAPPPARQVTPSGSDGVEAFDDALGIRVLPVSLLASTAPSVREGNGHLKRSHEAMPDPDSSDSDPPDPDPSDDSVEDATGSTDTAEPSDDGDASTTDDDSRGVLDTLTDSVVVRPVVRFLYAVGYAEVTAVRAVLRGLGLRSPDDGGES